MGVLLKGQWANKRGQLKHFFYLEFILLKKTKIKAQSKNDKEFLIMDEYDK